jgi:dihydroorotate dehydrogenase
MFDAAYRAIRPALRRLDAEYAHRLTIQALRAVPHFISPPQDDPRLKVRLFGLDFPNPIGLAAGFDKNAQVPDAMLRLGFGFAEVGTITPIAQTGNPKPRLFRLEEDKAVINRMGFNNQGFARAKARLIARARRPGIVGVNIGANKDSPDRIADYVKGLQELGGCASYIAVNISSPNTPGLRGLQNRSELDALLQALSAARAKLPNATPLLLKIAPDLDDEALRAIAEVALARRIDGLVVSNTTIARPPDLRSPLKSETGGLSGAPLFELSTKALRTMRRLLKSHLPLIGVGGISSGAQAYAKIRAGASLVQLYTALAYEGPGLVSRIKSELLACMSRDGLASIADAIGLDA